VLPLRPVSTVAVEKLSLEGMGQFKMKN